MTPFPTMNFQPIRQKKQFKERNEEMVEQIDARNNENFKVKREILRRLFGTFFPICCHSFQILSNWYAPMRSLKAFDRFFAILGQYFIMSALERFVECLGKNNEQNKTEEKKVSNRNGRTPFASVNCLISEAEGW